MARIAHSSFVESQYTGMDHRLGRRRRLTLPVGLERSGGPAGYGRVLNVSLSGAYIETSSPFSLFIRVDFVCGRMLYERIGASRMTAFVSRVTARGVALEWFEFAAPAIRRLVAFAETA